MPNRSQFTTLLALLALGAAACGTSSTSSSGQASGCTGTVTVATELPVSGNDASDGVPTQNGAVLAVDQANANHTLNGCTLTVISKDDTSAATGAHDPTQGASNMTALTGNPLAALAIGGLLFRAACRRVAVAWERAVAEAAVAEAARA